MTVTGLIFDIRRFSIHDGPGIRTTIFLKGCPLDCWWCHNPEGQRSEFELIFRPERCDGCGICVDACSQNAISWIDTELVTDAARCVLCGDCCEACFAEAREIAGKSYDVREILQAVTRDRVFYDQSNGGVTISGGEPLSQPSFAREILAGCKKEHISTALDTSGYAPWKVIESLRPFVDLFLFDLKIINDEEHKKYTGVSNQLILENLKRLADEGSRIIIRVPIIPGITDTAKNIEDLRLFIQGLKGVERVDLLPYHNSASSKYARTGRCYPLESLSSPSNAEMDEITKTMQASGLNVQLGG